MGVANNVGSNVFPKQGALFGKRVGVIFGYDTALEFSAICVRDDAEDPHQTIFRLEDGRHVLSTECQYNPFPTARPLTLENRPGLLEAVRAASERGELAAEHEGQIVFINDGKSEERYGHQAEHACPTCGGSGHKDDAHARICCADFENCGDPCVPRADHWRRIASGQSAAARDVLAERERQVLAEGWTPAHDDEHADGSMAQAAACYALNAQGIPVSCGGSNLWPWSTEWWKPKDRRRDLVRAAALLLAEIERMDRAAA